MKDRRQRGFLSLVLSLSVCLSVCLSVFRSVRRMEKVVGELKSKRSSSPFSLYGGGDVDDERLFLLLLVGPTIYRDGIFTCVCGCVCVFVCLGRERGERTRRGVVHAPTMMEMRKVLCYKKQNGGRYYGVKRNGRERCRGGKKKSGQNNPETVSLR